MTLVRVILSLAIIHITTACERIDSLSVQDQPGGTAVLVHALVGDDKQVICVRGDSSERCDEKTADVIVQGFAEIADVEVTWLDYDNNDTVRVIAGSGKIVRANRGALDRKIKIVVAAR